MTNRRGGGDRWGSAPPTVRADGGSACCPGAHVLTRPRLFNSSAFAGEKKITRLPRRSADRRVLGPTRSIAIAEAHFAASAAAAAVVDGPRSRPAPATPRSALYQSGDVRISGWRPTAIGMGLNLDVDHVRLPRTANFDGYQFRRLNPAELAQIAGRAGRASRDGTFGTPGRCPPFERACAWL